MPRDLPQSVHIAPSILAADFMHLEDEVRRCEGAGLSVLHCDVMDGHFVPNLTFGPPLIAQMRKLTNLELDVHLMIEAPERSLEQYARAGADSITVHAEVSPHLHRTLSKIKELGCRAGVSLNPSTPLSVIEPVLEELDILLIMSVNPGFGGQKFIRSALDKIAEASDLKASGLGDYLISVDGGVDAATAPEIVAAGAQRLVAGSAVFGGDFSSKLSTLRGAVKC
jgi:ribulose-phosphate 3-epimerase